MYAIVTFLEENDAPGIVSTNWLDRDKNICLYPNVKSELRKNKLLVGREEPRPEWTECPIKLLREFVSYESAKAHLSEAELTSNLESEGEDGPKKRQRRERVIILPGEESTSDDDDEQVNSRGRKLLHNRPKDSLRPPPPPPPPPSPPPPPPPPSSHLHPPLTIEIPSSQLLSSSPSGSSNSSHSSVILQLKANQELMWKVIGDFSKIFERVEQKMDRAIEILDAQTCKTMEAAVKCAGDEQLLSQLPVKVEEVEAFEEKLKEPAGKQKLIKYLSALGAKDVKGLAANVMRHLFQDEVGEKYSLTGKVCKVGPGKKAFLRTESFRLVHDTCTRKFRQAEEAQIREAVSDWLMQAKFRKLRRENRRTKVQEEMGE